MPRNQSGKISGTTARTRFGVLLLTDVFGIQSTENRRNTLTPSLVDSFARAGYVAVAPGLFDKKPRTEETMASFDATEFFGAHGPAVTDPRVEKAIAYMRDKMDIGKIASTGYCFGGRYAFRALGLPQDKGVQVGFAAHPTLLGDDEIKAIKGPASLALAGDDQGLLAKRRTEMEAAMGTTGQT
ncbi:Protein AIM2 [Colletotrichum tanaceti]|nr:Protein AIM2 [Colletotrichum tanaceti]